MLIPFQFSRFSRPSSFIFQFILIKNSSIKLFQEFGKYSISTSSTSFSIAERLKRQKELSKPKEEKLKQLNDFIEIEKKVLPMDILKQFKLIIQLNKDLEDKMVIKLIKNLRGVDVSSFCPLRLEDVKLFIGAIDRLVSSLPDKYPETPKIVHTAFESIFPPMFSKNVYEPQIIQTNLRTLEARFVDSRIIGHLIVEFKSTETIGENKLDKFEFTITALYWLRKQMTYLLHRHGAGEFNQLKIPEWLKQKSLE
ncbi:hypothetical protein ACQ4LE_004218 [Meloidogyne hapla]|uniref:Uncharacterized protein n=1 Tax=Meloidogyne hapla TaxID=6305 RepID=A0A1I8BUY0_MELHA